MKYRRLYIGGWVVNCFQFAVRHPTGSNMAFSTKTYSPWRPNKAVVKFFENMKRRKIAQPTDPTTKITDSSAPKSDGFSRAPREVAQQKRVKVNYASPSDTLVSTARAQTGYKRQQRKRPSPRQPKAVKATTSKARKKAAKKDVNSIEKKLRKIKL